LGTLTFEPFLVQSKNCQACTHKRADRRSA
jgi:hypothetical protein